MSLNKFLIAHLFMMLVVLCSIVYAALKQDIWMFVVLLECLILNLGQILNLRHDLLDERIKVLVGEKDAIN